MLPLLRVAAGLASTVSARAGDGLRRLLITLIALVLALVGTGFLTAAGWIALFHELGPIVASLITGAAFLLLALALLFFAGRSRQAPLGIEAKAVMAQAQVIAQRLPDEIAKAPAVSLMGAFIGGLMLAQRLRR